MELFILSHLVEGGVEKHWIRVAAIMGLATSCWPRQLGRGGTKYLICNS